jgi:hypothetical protein
MSLTEVAIRAAKPREKAYKVYDEKGLFLLVLLLTTARNGSMSDAR